MPWNQGITGTHLKIAAFVGNSLRVVTGPGTGKTFALMRHITRLLEEGVPPAEILAVTFTRTATNDLVDKIATLGAPGANQVAAKTLHSLSFGLLSKAAVLQSIGRVARPLMDLRTRLFEMRLTSPIWRQEEGQATFRGFRGLLGNSSKSSSWLAKRSYRAAVRS